MSSILNHPFVKKNTHIKKSINCFSKYIKGIAEDYISVIGGKLEDQILIRFEFEHETIDSCYYYDWYFLKHNIIIVERDTSSLDYSLKEIPHKKKYIKKQIELMRRIGNVRYRTN